MTEVEIEKFLAKVIADMARLCTIKKHQLELFHEKCPNNCGIIDFDNVEVEYDDLKYTKWFSNYGIEMLEDYIRTWNFVGLDFELRLAKLVYDTSGCFTIKIPDSEKEIEKYWIAAELQSRYQNYYRELLMKNGMDVWKMEKYKYSIPWTGCEKEIKPEVYGNKENLMSEGEIYEFLRESYPVAYKKVTGPKPVCDIKFETVGGEKGEQRICKARLDEKSLKECRENGFHLWSIQIDKKKFGTPMEEIYEDGRKLYLFQFVME